MTTEVASSGRKPRLSINLGRLLLEFGRDYERRVMDLLHERGHPLIRPSHFTVFANLSEGAVRVTELAERAHVTQQAMGKMLKEMERIGYIVRDIDGSDRRAKKIRPTQRGLDLMRDSAEAVDEVRGFYLQQVGEESITQLEECLGDCVSRLDLASISSWKEDTRVA
ncbi:MAG: MarR family transcriptional regulator [Halieaceae bacterium]|jgi:DNA-binding MarR family transcriptional regulator|nr:MarR family transcriptional regulator [Halieaceae bacterium]